MEFMKIIEEGLKNLDAMGEEQKQNIQDPIKRAGVDVEIYKLKQRIKEVIDERSPKELRKAKLTGDKPIIPEYRMRDFQDDIETALDENKMLQKLEKGTLLRHNVKDFAKVNPYRYNRIAYDMYKKYVVNKENIPYSKKLSMSYFLQKDLTGLKEGVFNVIDQQAEPIQNINKDINQKASYVKANLKRTPLEEQASVSERYSAL